MKKLPAMNQRGSVVLALSITLLFGAGCKNFFPPNTTTGTGTTPTNTGDYAYVVSVNTAASAAPIYTLSGFAVGEGKLAELTDFPLTLKFAPVTAVIAPSNALLYVAGSQVVEGYTISSTGALTAILNTNQQPPLVNANIISMIVSPDGNWLLALDSALNTIDEYPINSSGQLATGTAFSYAVTGGATIVPNNIAVSPDGNFVAASLGTGGDVLFSFATSTGVLKQVAQIDTGSTSGADQAVAFDSTSSILFVAQSGTGAGVTPFVISGGGMTLTAAVGAPFPLGAGASSMTVDTTGKYLYVGNRTSNNISGFSIGAGGVLTPLTGSPYAAGTSVDAVSPDNSGKYILSTALNGSPDLKMYSFDATNAGALDASTTASTGDTTEPAGAVALALTH